MRTAIVLALPLMLAGCAAVPAPAAAPAPAAVSVTNCGFEVTVDSPPQRIVTIKSTSTELVVALGLGDRIVGQAFPDGPLPEGSPDVPLISDFAPSEEAVIDLEPDFVFGGWESNFTPEAAGDRAELRDLGIATYVSPAACKGEYQPPQLSFDDVFAYIGEAGDLLGAADEAAALITEQKTELDAVPQNGDGLTALWWSSGTDVPYVGAGIGAPELIMDTVGLTNIAGDIDDTWSPLSVEAIIAANPDVIVLIDASWNTAQSKMDYLASNPATAAMPAVVNHRYLVLPFAASEAGVRTVAAAASLAEQLAELG